MTPKTAKDEARASSERMKTEVIHAQAQEMSFLRNKLIEAEDTIRMLQSHNNSLVQKLKSTQRLVEQLQGEPDDRGAGA